VGDFVSFPVENSVGWRVDDGSFVGLPTRANGAAADRFASNFTFINIEAAVIRVGPEARPTTTRGRAV
jgi:hypothetical protein